MILVGRQTSLSGQDAEFSQFYHAPVYLNPALIGFSEAPRFTLNFRDHLPAFNHAFISSSVSYDQHFHDINSSIGLNIVADIAGNLLNTYQINGVYAYQLSVTDNLYVKTGIQAGVLYQTINTEQILFGDQINPAAIVDNMSFPTNELSFENTSITKLDLGVGFAVYNNDFFAGASFKHLNRPTFSYTGVQDDAVDLEIRSSIHFGNTFYLNDPFMDKYQLYFTPTLMLANQGSFSQVTAGAYVGRGAIFGGIWLRHALKNSDALIFMVGVKEGIFRVGYSYDANLGKVQTAAGAHELSLSFDLGQTEYIKKRARMRGNQECPVMFR